MNKKAISILIAEDSTADRMILKAIVEKEGYQVLLASNGVEAVDIYKEKSPDIILLDVMMPEMDGISAAKIIKEFAGETMVPIIFLSSLTSADDLAECLDAGGDDFLSKPYNQVIIRAKIHAFYRMRKMHETLQVQRDQIVLHNERMVHEQEVAKAVFDNVAHSGCMNLDCIQFLLSPMSIFNGDIILAGKRPDGDIYVLLGDFTGHGLPAAIGSMPMADIFYGMTAKGFLLPDILQQINMKLKKILPVGIFCCCVMIHIAVKEGMFHVWSGGLPEGFLYKPKAKEIHKIPSTHLPLGILSEDKFNSTLQIIEMTSDDRLFFWSDGIHEAINEHGEMFGEERILEVFDNNHKPKNLFQELKDSVYGFIGKADRDDDLTLLELTLPEVQQSENNLKKPWQGKLEGPTHWQIDFMLYPETLRNFNPLPLLLHILMELPVLRPHSTILYTMLAELYSNALEHGVMGLSSELKQQENGFALYYKERTDRLSQLKDGFVRFDLKHELVSNTEGQLVITVEDSGKGFDVSKKIGKKMSSNMTYSGRGLSLLQTACSSIDYNEKGNIITVCFDWHV